MRKDIESGKGSVGGTAALEVSFDGHAALVVNWLISYNQYDCMGAKYTEHKKKISYHQVS